MAEVSDDNIKKAEEVKNEANEYFKSEAYVKLSPSFVADSSSLPKKFSDHRGGLGPIPPAILLK